MKKTYQAPDVEVTLFLTDEVIFASVNDNTVPYGEDVREF